MSLIVALPLFVLGITSSLIYINQKSKSEETSLLYNSESLVNGFDYSMSYLRQYYVTLFSSAAYRWMDAEQSAPYDKIQYLVNVQKRLTGESNPNLSIQFYCYINVKYNWLLSNNGLTPFSSISNKSFFDDFLEKIMEDSDVISWLDIPSTDGGGSAGAEYGYYDVEFSGRFLCLKRINSFGRTESLLLVKISDFLFSDLYNSAHNLKYDLGIVNGSLQIFSNENGKKLIGRTGRVGNFIVSNIDSISSGFKYVIWQDISSIEKESDVFLFASLFVLVGFFAVIILIHFIYSLFTAPMKKMSAELEMQNKLDKEHFFKSLLQSSLSDEDIVSEAKRWNIPLNAAFVYVLIKNKDKSIADYSSIELPFLLCPIMPVNGRFGAILYSMQKEDMERLVSSFFELIKQKSDSSILMGCSRVFTDLNKCKAARSEAGEAFLNKDSSDLSGSALFLFDDYLQNGYSRGIVDDTIENDLGKAVCDGDLHESEQMIELILNRMEVRGLTGVDRSFYVSKILTIIFSVIINSKLVISDVFDSETYDKIMAYKELKSTKPELKDFLVKDVIKPTIQKINALKRNEDSDIVQRVYALISEYQGNITLSECADIICCHPNTITKLLKTKKNTSFTEIVSGVKEKQAKYYLLTTELSVNQVAQHLGYANVQNFGRFFKDRTGFTPLKYRELNFT